MISVLILTLNEECNLAECIQSLPDTWRKDVLIIDSQSTDRTIEIAQELGARTIIHPFENYALQRNFGLSQSFTNDWILMLDADERVTRELAEEIEQRLVNISEKVGMLRVRRKDIFLGKWLKRSSGYPTFFPRFFRVGAVKVSRAINEEYECELLSADLNEHLLHFPFNKGLLWWYQRHAKYAAMEAEVLGDERSHRPVLLRNLVSSDPSTRRKSLKQLAYRLPGRPILVFWYLYVIRGGFLDGRAGYQYARMRSAYENMIDTIFYARKYGERI
ncbi:MAG: glycosyltransferase family 2 protein [Henriciella sp.]